MSAGAPRAGEPMWAVVFHRYGGPGVLEMMEAPVPRLRPGEVLVRTASSGLSAVDLDYRSGAVRPHGLGFPKQTGFDALGQVVDSRSAHVPVGAWVWCVLGLEPLRRRGTAVEYLAIDDTRVGLFPQGWIPPEQLGSLPLGALTALCALRDAARAQPGQRILVVGAGGAVGTAALQLARMRGIEADAVAGASGLEVCAELSAQEVVDRHDSRGMERLRRGPYDAVILAAGRAEDWIEAVRPAGRMALTRPAAAWPGLCCTSRVLRRRLVLRPVLAGHEADDLTRLASLAARGRLRPVVGRTYGIEDLVRAHAEYGRGGTSGARLIIHRRGAGPARRR